MATLRKIRTERRAGTVSRRAVAAAIRKTMADREVAKREKRMSARTARLRH